jgi:signal transduction histidine kinase
MEISILRTASEMIGTTLQRWGIQTQLSETLDKLELRVEERTSDLNAEIQQRQRAQNDLETRLQIEEILAAISARLLEPTGIRANIAASLEDLARIMNAGRIFLAELNQQSEDQLREFIEWRSPEVPPVSEDVLSSSMAYFPGLRDRLLEGETIYIDDTTQLPGNSEIDLQFLQDRNVRSLVLSPIVIDHSLQAVLGCSNLQASADLVRTNLRIMDLVTSMLKSLLQREHLIQTLEEQVAERTRQLTTFLDMAMLSDQAQDLADLLQPTLLSITQIAACDAAAIHIIGEEGSSLELIAQRGLPPKHLPSLREVAIDDDFATWLAETDPYEVMGDLDSLPFFLEPWTLPDFGAFIVNHLRTGDKSLGLLSCYRIDDQQFSPFQETLLTALGELLGIIVENYRLRFEAGELAAVEERQRLAREIHDAVSQSVYSLSLFSRSARDALDEQDQAKLLASLQDIENTALGAMREMRLLLYQLREAGQEGDIASALDTRFKQVEDRLGIQATCEIGSDIMLPAHIQYELQRIIIEALNNVVKHANASRVQVQISCLDENLIASVRDDGIGFDSDVRFSGMGLKNMQARAVSLGGDLDIITKSGQGTRMDLKIPMACLDQGEGDLMWRVETSAF